MQPHREADHNAAEAENSADEFRGLFPPEEFEDGVAHKSEENLGDLDEQALKHSVWSRQPRQGSTVLVDCRPKGGFIGVFGDLPEMIYTGVAVGVFVIIGAIVLSYSEKWFDTLYDVMFALSGFCTTVFSCGFVAHQFGGDWLKATASEYAYHLVMIFLALGLGTLALEAERFIWKRYRQLAARRLLK